MKKEDIHFGDWQRMFAGDVPAGFYWEVMLRIVIIYLVLMISMRLMGKRMASQLSRNELIALVSLSAAIGVPLQAPDRGILAAIVIAIVVIAIQQLLAAVSSRNQRLESFTQGDLTVLIADGRLAIDSMKETGITKEKAFAQLRSNGIRHLGEVKRLYFEAGGAFTLIRETAASPGLGILPEEDADFIRQVCCNAGFSVCTRCGQKLTGAQADKTCENCGSRERAIAVE
nr:YetF domain-containing protein [uncultured Dyadobacter sp.]